MKTGYIIGLTLSIIGLPIVLLNWQGYYYNGSTLVSALFAIFSFILGLGIGIIITTYMSKYTSTKKRIH